MKRKQALFSVFRRKKNEKSRINHLIWTVNDQNGIKKNKTTNLKKKDAAQEDSNPSLLRVRLVIFKSIGNLSTETF